MTDITSAALQDCITRYRVVFPELEKPAAPSESDTPQSLIDRYERCYPLLEKAMWSGTADFEPLLDCYQSLFREQEALIRQQAASTGCADKRYHFILSIPVADRPSHLHTCLESLLEVCERFGYGGKTAGIYSRIKIIVAEDSRGEHNIRRHIELVESYRRKGLQVFHLGQAEQYELLQSIPGEDRKTLGNILTTQPKDRFYLKGQAANRNLSVLKCLQLTEDRNRTLYYFVDSDESFCVNRRTGSGEQPVYAVNYFHSIDRIFRSTDTLVLTGKLVGDPPVSPAVMAANFLDDVTAFFDRLAELHGSDDCRFHDARQASSADTASGAVYHDMAGLFGFDNKATTFPYRCPLPGKHDHAACLRAFSGRLADFFFGEHLTRKTFFSYGGGFCELTPARTVYPGNTIVNYEGLKYVIPFGHLRLRMSGPTAGRLIAAEIHDRFVSANLPHLHRRTNDQGLGEAFRPGVELTAGEEQETIDLSNEFERQFFGDLMLFTTEALVAEADVLQDFARNSVARVLEKKERELLALYSQKHEAILAKADKLNELVFNGRHWWVDAPNLEGALQQVRVFMDNIQRNFSEQSAAWRAIQSVDHRAGRKQQILNALMNYRTERDVWDRLF